METLSNSIIYRILKFAGDYNLGRVCKKFKNYFDTFYKLSMNDLIKICRAEDINMLQRYINQNPDYDLIFEAACLAGSSHIARCIIPKGGDLEEGLIIGATHGHINIILLLVGDFCVEPSAAIKYACINGHFECAKELIKYSEIFKSSWDAYDSLAGAIKNNHIEIVKLLENSNISQFDVDRAFYYSCKFNSGFDYLLPRVVNFNYGLSGACKAGNYEIFNILVEKGANNFDYVIGDAIAGGNQQIIEFLIKKDAGFDFPPKNDGKRLRETLGEIILQNGIKKLRVRRSLNSAGTNPSPQNIVLEKEEDVFIRDFN